MARLIYEFLHLIIVVYSKKENQLRLNDFHYGNIVVLILYYILIIFVISFNG